MNFQHRKLTLALPRLELLFSERRKNGGPAGRIFMGGSQFELAEVKGRPSPPRRHSGFCAPERLAGLSRG